MNDLWLDFELGTRVLVHIEQAQGGVYNQVPPTIGNDHLKDFSIPFTSRVQTSPANHR